MRRPRADILWLLGLVLLAPACTAPPPREVTAPHADTADADRAAIREMAGWYQVTTRIVRRAEEGQDSEPPLTYRRVATERVMVIHDTPDLIELQHLLLLGEGQVVLKHWRERWEPGPRSMLDYRDDRSWGTRPVDLAADRAGRWTRTVFGPDDSPVYGSVGRWRHAGTSSRWSGEEHTMPLPPSLEDLGYGEAAMAYEVVTVSPPWSWREMQCYSLLKTPPPDLIPTGGATEVATTTYIKLEDVPPDYEAAAAGFTSAVGRFWEVVRDAWDEVLDRRLPFVVRSTVDGQPLWKRVFALAEEARVEPDGRDWRGEVEALLDRYVVPVRTIAE